MIARFTCQLPVELHIREVDRAGLGSFSITVDEIKVTFYPPSQAAEVLNTNPHFIAKREPYFVPRDTVSTTEELKIDGSATIPSNLVVIDFQRESFTRLRNQPDTSFDPPLGLVQRMFHLYLSSIRTVTQAPRLKPRQISTMPWVIEYLNDDLSQLPEDANLFRTRFNGSFEISWVSITSGVWEQIGSVIQKQNEVLPWEALYLDAISMLPDSGAAIVLTFSSLETLIAYALDILVDQKGFPRVAWDWIRQPGEDYRKEPSPSDLYSSILSLVAGKSLKDEASLWQLFVEIKKVRNNYVHEGALTGTDGNIRTQEEIRGYILGAGKIIEWVEALLPEDRRRKRNTAVFTIQAQTVIGPLN